ncbi:unnamed protein product, partial [Mesorhabditis belari]|uniref:C2 domain-containing protein n=1 Tax=Mesorhabditis belari TaxID=2138241 RepID=A0AAF3J9Y0_9BILA
MTVRVIESRNLRDSGNLRVRVGLDGRTKPTRVTTELHPKWQQNLNFAIEESLEKAANKMFSIQIMHQPGGVVLNKWISLAPPPKDGRRAERDEDIGFIKASIAVYGARDTPPIFEDDDESEEIFNARHFTGHTLRIRLHRLLQLISEVRHEIISKGKKPKTASFCIKAFSGDCTEVTSLKLLKGSAVSFDQELLLPFLWPTVINKFHFQLIMHRGKKNRIIAQTSLPLSDVYSPGEDGYLPQFGPAFLNFYGRESLPKLKKFGDKKLLPETELVKFYGRISVSVDCIDWIGDSTERTELSYNGSQYFHRFERLHHYTLFASMIACNKINRRFASDNVSFLISMGDYGTSEHTSPLPRSSTHPAMPDHDDCRDFCMGWGNQQPLIEFGALWENVQYRIERSNAISAIANVLDKLLAEVAALGGHNDLRGADLMLEAIEMANEMLKKIERHHCPDRLQTQHDFLHQETRQMMIEDIRDEITTLKHEELSLEKAVDELIRMTTRISQTLRRLARDAESSLPDILVKMVAGTRVVAYARIAPRDIMHSNMGKVVSGRFCGKARAIPLTWLDGVIKKRSITEEIPAVVHVRMWLGRNVEKNAYLSTIRPAESRCYWEVYHYQNRSTPISPWTSIGHFDYRGQVVDVREGPQIPEGWQNAGVWAIRNTHERWVASDQGRVVYDDKLYELQERSTKGWRFRNYTDVWGGKISEKVMNTPTKGWAYEGEWTRDLHTPGGEGPGDRAERLVHMFRRRILTRTRRREEVRQKSNTLAAMQDALLADDYWEYTSERDGPYHDKCMTGDRLRRRRFVIPVTKTIAAAKNFNIVRQYEVHEVVSQWQLRVYIFWAKDLLPLTKDFSSRAFVRVSYLHSTKQTAVVDRTANPVFNETLIFDKLLIPGAHHVITDCPPSVFVEVKGERHDDSECFMGCFTAAPTVICSATDRRASMRWMKLHFGSGKTRGALLCAFELFLRDQNHKIDLPLVPAKKKAGRIEVPMELRPKFSKYSIQMLCWGVRNLHRHNLLTVRRPFISMIFGDVDAKTKALNDVKENPNFTEPLLSFQEILLPDELSLAPPLIFNLHDQRAFRRAPLVGVCLISDYKRFVKQAILQKVDHHSFEWGAFDQFVETEEASEEGKSASNDESILGEYRIDWWSKFYTSNGNPEKAPGFDKTGIEQLRIFRWALEDTVEYGRFCDFLDTFQFKKSAKGHFDDHEEKEVTGELKGRLFLKKYEDNTPPILAPPAGIEFIGVTSCCVRLYVVSAAGLVIKKTNRACDSYVIARIGKQKLSRKNEYRPDEVNPEYGEVFEWDVTLPLEKDLTITVMNRKRIVRDDEIGSTTIDLENRLLTKHRATVGLARQYTITGELTWRDQMSPLAILKRYCERMKIPPPQVLFKKGSNEEVIDVGLKILEIDFWLLTFEKDAPERPRVGRPAQRVALYILNRMGLVPEHVETRALFDSHGGKQKVGDLLCWVDIFPRCIGPIPAPIDISIRRPEPYQLRIAVFNVFNAVVCKRNFQQPCGDLYIKAFINGNKKGEKTDTHFRVLDGYASFNYRLLLDFDWNPWEKRIYAKEKKRFMRKSRSELVKSLLVLQLWDKSRFSKDTLLGELVLDLQGFQEGMMDPDEIEAVYYSHLVYRNLARRCILHSWRHRPQFCCNPNRKTNLKKKSVIPLPKAPLYKAPKVDSPFFHPFEGEPLHGYFPMLRKGCELPNEQKLDYDAHKKKDDDFDVNAEKEYVTGVVEIEMQLLSKEEADAEPVGRKRKKPNQNPRLGKPDRSAWDSNWFLSRIRPALRHFWNKYGKVILVWLAVIILWLIILIAISINIPIILKSSFSSGMETVGVSESGGSEK